MTHCTPVFARGENYYGSISHTIGQDSDGMWHWFVTENSGQFTCQDCGAKWGKSDAELIAEHNARFNFNTPPKGSKDTT